MKNKTRYWLTFIILFLLLNAFFLSCKNWFAKHETDSEVLMVGNLVIFTATLLSFFISSRSFQSANPNTSVRGMYGSFMVKFFICIIAAFVYIMLAKKNVNKPALFICMGLYVVYTFIEISVLTKMLKQKKNA